MSVHSWIPESNDSSHKQPEGAEMDSKVVERAWMDGRRQYWPCFLIPSTARKRGVLCHKTDTLTESERWQCDCSCRAYIWWNCGPLDARWWGEDESGRTTLPNDLWGNERVEQIFFMSVSLTWVLGVCVCVFVCLCVRGVTATNHEAQVWHPTTPPIRHTHAGNHGIFLPLCQMTRAEKQNVGQTNSRRCCLSLYLRKRKTKPKHMGTHSLLIIHHWDPLICGGCKAKLKRKKIRQLFGSESNFPWRCDKGGFF